MSELPKKPNDPLPAEGDTNSQLVQAIKASVERAIAYDKFEPNIKTMVSGRDLLAAAVNKVIKSRSEK